MTQSRLMFSAAALVVKSGANWVGLLAIDGEKVSYAKVDGKNYDMATGLTPLNVQVTPDGKLGIMLRARYG
jgi:hypothetical protein